MGSPVPYRVDLFGDEVDSIRTFDPDSQRSLYPVPEVRLLPGREFPMDEDARAAFRARWREKMEGDPTKVRLYKDIGAGIATAGIEYYLPLFFDATATIFDYLGANATLALHGEVDEALKRFWTDTRERHRFLQHDRERPILRAGRAVPEARGLLRAVQPAPAAGAARPASRNRMGAPAARHQRRPRRARAAEEAAAARRHHAAPRADRRRERGPAREPARAAARQPDRAAERRLAGRVPGRRRTFRDRRRAARRRLLLVRTRRRASRSSSSPRPNCSPPARPRGGAASRSRSATSTR